MPAPSRSRPPWPMKWVVLAIIVSIGAYTFFTLRYRRPERAFQPYQDLRDRANVQRLLAAGYQRVALDADLPADSTLAGSTARVASAAAGLPPSLRDTLVEFPQLPAEILGVSAAASTNSMFAYPIGVRCTLPDNKQQLAGAELYVRGDELIVTPNFEHLSGTLLARSRERLIRLTVPAGTLKPGSYHVTLVGARGSKTWPLLVH